MFKAVQSNLENKDGEKKFYPRVQNLGSIGTDQIANEIAEYSSLSPGDVKNTLDNLVRVMTIHLQSSQSVTLDGLGSFRISMRSKGKGADTASEVSASQATLRVVFTPTTTRNADRTVATRSLITGARCMNMDSLFADSADNNDVGSTPENE